MTRKLECKAASRLLRNAFAAKGAALTHTEALDLLAQLEGYEAWSHMKAAHKKSPAAKKSAKLTFQDVVLERFGAWCDFPNFPRSDWQYLVENGDTTRGYIDSLLFEHLVDDYPELEGTEFEVPRLSCLDLNGKPVTWNIESDLTDRWGEINTVKLDSKPGIVGLMLNDGLLEELRSLMSGEDTFIVCKDGKYGILYELEYMSDESDGVAGPVSLRSHTEVVSVLLNGLQDLGEEFPGVSFCVPPAAVVFMNRPAVWAYVPQELAKAMGEDKKRELGERLASL